MSKFNDILTAYSDLPFTKIKKLIRALIFRFGDTDSVFEGDAAMRAEYIAADVVVTNAYIAADALKVTGPASAVNGHLAVFDGTTGKLIKDGGAVPAGGGAAGPFLARTDATALSSATITTNAAAGNNRYTLASATGVPITLPAATGAGTVLEFRVLTKSTSNGYVFDFGVSPGSNTFKSALAGRAALEAGALTSVNVTTAGNHNRITLLNGYAGTGGDVNDVIRFTDVATNAWHVEGLITVDTTTATFSAY